MMCRSEDVHNAMIKGEEDYEPMPQYDYDDAILDRQNEDI